MRGIARAVVAAVVALGAAATLPGAANAQGPPPPMPLPAPKVHPIQVTGPPAQRLNLIILGDGYQWDQGSLFMADVDRNLSVMWATEPFRSYRNYMNVYQVSPGQWSAAGSMILTRGLHSATVLADGRVLVAGGQSAVTFGEPSSELYNPSTQTSGLVGSLSGLGGLDRR